MRIATASATLTAEPGSTATLVLDITNTVDVIDGVSARVHGLPEPQVRCDPQLLPLFPDATGQLTLNLLLAPTQAAGRHPLSIEVQSHGAKQAPQYVDVDLDIARRLSLRTASRPRVVRTRRAGRFVLDVSNPGNVPLDVSVQAGDADRASTVRVSPSPLLVAPGATVPVIISVRGPRMFSGSELDRTITITTTATPADQSPDVPIDPAETLTDETTARLRQRPLVSRGLMTALILASIVTLWALAFQLGTRKVFAGEQLTKAAPGSFFAGSPASALDGTQPVALTTTAPLGAPPKSGQLPAGLGGQITGTVLSVTERQPVGRILVEAIRVNSKGKNVVVSSTASLADGTYTLAGLFPTNYFLHFTSPGFADVWYPSPASATASGVQVNATGVTSGIDVVVKGLPATISGDVDPPVRTTIKVRSLYGGGKVIASATTNAAGGYTLPKLPSPATLELTFTAEGYESTSIIDTIGGGDDRVEPTVRLGSTVGAIGGIVTADGTPLGGATVTTQAAGKPTTVMTPTVGQVGSYVLPNLPTPATYVITVTAPGRGSLTITRHLSPGQSIGNANVELVTGTGSITGTVLRIDPQTSRAVGFGGVSVTVGGMTDSSTSSGTGGAGAGTPTAGAAAPTTTTLTSGDVGSFTINGLPSPGVYTLTFTVAGYTPTTVQATLTADRAPPSVKVTLSSNLGSITGTVTDPTGQTLYTGATVTATNGLQKWTTTTSEPGGALPRGGYLLAALPAGTYSVTVSRADLTQQTALVTVRANANTPQNFTLEAN